MQRVLELAWVGTAQVAGAPSRALRGSQRHRLVAVGRQVACRWGALCCRPLPLCCALYAPRFPSCLAQATAVWLRPHEAKRTWPLSAPPRANRSFSNTSSSTESAETAAEMEPAYAKK